MRRPIAVFSTRTEADIARARLTFEGIEAAVVTDSAGGWEPQLDAIRGVRLLVDEEDAADAIEILGVSSDMVPDLPGDYPSWAYVTAGLVVAALVIAGLALAVASLL